MSVRSRISRWLRQLGGGPVDAPPAVPFWTPPERWDDHFAAAAVKPSAWLKDRRGAARLYGDLSESAIAAVRQRWPHRVERTLRAADRICAHEFDLLGSGPVVIKDPDRRATPKYSPIDWNIDPIANLRFPLKFPHKAWKPSMRPGLADVKWPWEIGRCQHWVTLGQAYRLSGDERYAQEIVSQHADFMEQNAVGVGQQFVCTMDVAIRAFNWALAFEAIRASRALDDTAIERTYRSLFDHGHFIEGNLENTYEVTSNHFLSNVVGLYAVGVMFKDLPAGQRWIARCRDWLEEEMRVQVLDDGADYESSVPYHRLVAELFLGAARVAEFDGEPLSSGYLQKLRQMMEFHQALTRPDGLMPQIGDADDGRLHIFTDYGTWKPQDGRHLLGPAGAMFGVPAWSAVGGEDGEWETAWWGFDATHADPSAMPAVVETLFPDAGLAVARVGRHYLLVTNGRVGTKGFGNHKHNDLLGFELHLDGTPLIVDPGSYVYTSNPDERNRFRSTAYHNTLRIDAVEQNDLRLDYLFRMFETSTVVHDHFTSTGDAVEYAGTHTGYERLPEPVTHQRTLRLLRSGRLEVTDRLSGAGSHTYDWHFHLAPGVTADVRDGAIVCTAGGRQWRLRAPADFVPVLSEAWYSPSFGVRVPCTAVDYRKTGDVASLGTIAFVIEPL